MSEDVNNTAQVAHGDRGPTAGDPASEPPGVPAPAFADGAGVAEVDGGDQARRRRGSRGGRNRRRPDGTSLTDGANGPVAGTLPATDSAGSPGRSADATARSPRPQRARSAQTGAGDARGARPGGRGGEYDRRPADLPDGPNEGVPSPEAAARATVQPKIGDSRPAPVPAAAAPVPTRTAEGRGPKRRQTPKPVQATGITQGPGAEPAGGGNPTPSNDDRDDARRKRRRKPVKSDARSPERVPSRPAAVRDASGRPLGRYLMCVQVRPGATQIAVLEGRSLTEHYVSRPTDQANQIHGNIYFGRVQNVLPGMEAAFVDIATPKNAVLYRGDLQFDAGDVDTGGSSSKVKRNDVRIEQVLRNGQMLVCQVTKNPIGTKGARLTQEVSLPGRFVVLIPNSDTYGISKRLPDDERRRLRKILDDVRPAGHGLIVRTAAEGASADELQRDVVMLSKQWDAITAKAASLRGPALLYREPDLAVRVIREEFNRNYRGVIIDDRAMFEEIRSYVESITPELADRVEFHDSSTEPLPLFERHHVHEQLHKAIDRKVWLPSGGSLIIERTEALTVIDVNTGKNVGSSSLEETVFRNNLEAADEIARQLRLRDIGGIIVIDFIDMESRSNRNAVVTAFRDALSRDKTRTQVFDISELGLVEMTRKRISEGLVESLSTTCPTCEGRGLVFDAALIRE